jgi:Sulfotransferase domain
MAHAKNMAHRLGIAEGADILVNLDADNFTGSNFSKYVAERFESFNDESFLYANINRNDPNKPPRGCSGRIAVTPNSFINSGGYDEKYETWSPDDKDFNLRLRRLGYTPQEIDRQYLNAVLHSDRMRFRDYPEANTVTDEGQFDIGSETSRVANFGKIGQGTVFKNFSSQPIDLTPIPTRIFGIGMHKTGTTSLHHAFQILGLNSAHWSNAHWARAIWKEMTSEGRSRTLERHYALSDLPIPFLYKELDKAYPGSKFILTIRNEASWLRSVKNHWNPEINQFRHQWNKDPFTHKAHKLLYGQRGFDEEIFLNRYRAHNAEVIEYFKDRKSDLLVLDIDKIGTWFPLCAFLKKKVPLVPYPRAYVTSTQLG